MKKCSELLNSIIRNIKNNRTLSICLRAFVFVLLFGTIILSVGPLRTSLQEDSREETELVITSTDEVTESGSVESKSEEKKTVFVNRLTGLPIDEQNANKRPVSVILNNADDAQPLLGISQADVIYECLAGSGVTRLMAVYTNPYTIPAIGPVTSSRSYFAYISQGLDAVHIHFGSTGEAQTLLDKDYIDNFNLSEYSEMFWRDEDRVMNNGYEYSVMTSGEKLKEAIDSSDIEKTYQDEPTSQKFSENSRVLQGSDCNTMTAELSFAKNTVFTYDEAGKFYIVSNSQTPQLDANTGAQNSRKNVLAIYVNIYSQSAGSSELGVDLEGEGTGYYAANGKVIPIKWARDSAEENFYFMYEDGTDLQMLPGSVYVCMVPDSKTIDIS